MAINGKQDKNQMLTEILAWVWLGQVKRAIKLLQDVGQDQMSALLSDASPRVGILRVLQERTAGGGENR